MSFSLPTGGNSWSLDEGQILNNGYNFKKLPAKFDTYFYTSSVKNFNLWMKFSCSTKCKIELAIGQIIHTIYTVGPVKNQQIFIGTFQSINGYNKITAVLSSLTHNQDIANGLVASFKIDGNLEKLSYVPNNKGNYFLWGRRGASCHHTLQQQLAQVSYYYSQVNVPINNDTIGTFYMANGFSEGYFGMQVISEHERKILFSVWSGYKTDDPHAIPAEYKVDLLRKGPDVLAQQFGGQGSGGQSFLDYNWVAGNTYCFLNRAIPQQNNATIYTAWFRDPANPVYSGWRLVAEWRRPKIHTYLKGIHCFIECFNPSYGNQSKMGIYANQWYFDHTKTWKEALKVRYTKDATGNQNKRRDVNGGLYANQTAFYLKTGGFFNETGVVGASFIREAKGIPPLVDFNTLP